MITEAAKRMRLEDWKDLFADYFPVDSLCDKFGMHYHPYQIVCRYCEKSKICKDMTLAFTINRDKWGWIDKEKVLKEKQDGK